MASRSSAMAAETNLFCGGCKTGQITIYARSAVSLMTSLPEGARLTIDGEYGSISEASKNNRRPLG